MNTCFSLDYFMSPSKEFYEATHYPIYRGASGGWIILTSLLGFEPDPLVVHPGVPLGHKMCNPYQKIPCFRTERETHMKASITLNTESAPLFLHPHVKINRENVTRLWLAFTSEWWGAWAYGDSFITSFRFIFDRG